MIASLEDVVQRMNEHGVQFIIIGGWAAIIHGAARTTNDVDLVYGRDPENLRRLVEALRPWTRICTVPHPVYHSVGTPRPFARV